MGSISGSLLLGKLWKIDIRDFGSKSAGGTNALRTVGAGFAILTLLIDLSKGFIPTYVIGYYSNYNEIEMMVGAFAAILGHVYPIFYKFNGGKGAATVLGSLIALCPLSIPYILTVWIGSVVLTGYVGISTILAALTVFIYSIVYFIPIILRNIIKLGFHYFRGNHIEYQKYKYRFNGLTSSILGLKSSLRPKSN